MYLLPLYLSFISFFVSILFGKWLGYKGSRIFTTFLIFLCNIVSLFIFYEVCLSHSICTVQLFSWIELEFLHIQWNFLYDPLTSVMLIVITTISLCAHFYSIEYMNMDPHQSRFMSYLSLFTFFMIILVTANNLLQLFVGWEGVGLCSYLLINFWFTRIQANKSAIKAMFINKISDLGFTLAICMLFVFFKSVNFSTIFMPIYFLMEGDIFFFNFNFNVLNFVCFFILFGAMGKSAQIGLHVWLPDAMEGPTPVSSLIHAATMVTAGIFLIIRCSFLFESASTISFVIIFVGALTAFFSSTTGVFQNDIKKVIAYSTCSQIGYMIYACGYSGYGMSMFHLSNHAFFKALLFLTAGSVIHSFLNDQDFRKMGGLLKVLPFSYVCLLIGSLSLAGFPYLTGFYSKDILLEASYNLFKETDVSMIQLSSFIHSFYWIATHSILYTCIYSLRVLSLTFFNYYNGFRSYLNHIHDTPLIMLIPLFFLSFCSVFVGFLSRDMMVGLGTDFWGNSFFIYNYLEYEFNELLNKSIPLFLSMYVLVLAGLFYNTSHLHRLLFPFKIHFLYYWVQVFFNKRWYFDKLYNSYVVRYFINFSSEISFRLFDKGSIELLGPYGIVSRLRSGILHSSKAQTGFLYHYSGLILNVLILFFLVLLFFFFSMDYQFVTLG
jgi:NADH-ubiquinone oxidoreductase chain 5